MLTNVLLFNDFSYMHYSEQPHFALSVLRCFILSAAAVIHQLGLILYQFCNLTRQRFPGIALVTNLEFRLEERCFFSLSWGEIHIEGWLNGDVKVIPCFVLKKGQLVQINQHEAFGRREHFLCIWS